MPHFDNFTKGLAIGIGVTVLLPVAVSTLAPVLKPVARSAIKTGLRATEKGREILAESVEKFEDLIAETQAEMRAEYMDPAAGAGQTPETAAESAAETAEPEAAAGQAEQAADNSNVRQFTSE